MNSYLFEFAGIWMPGFIIITAQTKRRAIRLFEKYLKTKYSDYDFHMENLKDGKIADNVEITRLPKTESVMLIYDGDY